VGHELESQSAALLLTLLANVVPHARMSTTQDGEAAKQHTKYSDNSEQ
jgi:hypothetical protein